MATKTKTKQQANNSETAKPIKQKFEFIQEQMPTVYVNHAQFAVSIFDASIVLGEITGADKNGVMQVIPRVKVLMSHDFTKEFARLLVRNIRAVGDNPDNSDDSKNEPNLIEMVSK